MELNAILRKSQSSLKRSLFKELSTLGYVPKTRYGFIYAEGTLPVLLVAHLDTVHRQRVKNICVSTDGSILMSPEGIGGDDRAGVYMVLQLVKKYRCHVLFCEDEESGGIGAHHFTKSKIRPDVNYIIEFDRRGSNDAVFYDCCNAVFTEFVCGFGFVEDVGSFSDISIIAPHLKVAAVNISAGYYNEHTRYEYIVLPELMRNIGIVGKMLETETERFEYIEAERVLYGDFLVRRLAPVAGSDYLLSPKGELLDSDDSIWMDEFGYAYELFEDMGIAAELTGYRVLNCQGLSARFEEDLATHIEVLPPEYI